MNFERIKNLQKKLIHPYFTTDLNELKYLIDFNGSSGGLLVENENFSFLSDSRYELEYRSIYGNNFVLIKENLIKTLIEVLNQKKINKISINSTKFNLNDYNKIKKMFPSITIEYLDNIVDDIRAIKSKKEIELIQNAIKISEDGFIYILSFLKEGISEKDVAIELEHCLKLKGADDISFPLIVLFGERTAYPHGKPSKDIKLKIGDVILIDFGILKENYVSDLTRTFCFGKILSDFKEIYYIVLEAQKRAFEEIKADANTKYIDSIARNYIGEKGFKNFFGHGLGHGIGIEVHEKPVLNPFTENLLKKGMIFTLEPAIYLPQKFGIRIEDIVLCESNNAKMLSDLPKEKILCI